MENIKRYKRVTFTQVKECHFFLAYVRVFKLKSFRISLKVSDIEKMWDTNPVNILHKMSLNDKGDFTHITTTGRKISFIKGKKDNNTVIIDLTSKPSFEFASQWIYELSAYCSSNNISVEYA